MNKLEEITDKWMSRLPVPTTWDLFQEVRLIITETLEEYSAPLEARIKELERENEILRLELEIAELWIEKSEAVSREEWKKIYEKLKAKVAQLKSLKGE